MAVISSWGRRVKEEQHLRWGMDAVPRDGKVYEGEFRLDSVRPLTSHEGGVLLGAVHRQWSIEHPEAEITYMDVTSSSPQMAHFQFIAHERSPIPPLAVILASFTAIVIAIAAVVIPLLKIALFVLAVLFVIRLIDYFTPKPPHYTCPVCGQTCFSTYEELVGHYSAVHPGVEPPPRPSQWLDYLKWGVLIVGGAIALRLVWPVLTRKKKE